MKRFSSSLIVAAAIFVTYGASAGFREDEVECEEAVARLAKCCPSFDPRALECSYYDHSGSCGIDVQYPALDEATSKCILALDCGSLEQSGVCDRARDVQPRHDGDADGGGVLSTGGSAGLCR